MCLSLFQELGQLELLQKEEVQAGVATANLKGDQEQASKSARGPARTCHRPWQGSEDFAGLCCAEFQPAGPSVSPHCAWLQRAHTGGLTLALGTMTAVTGWPPGPQFPCRHLPCVLTVPLPSDMWSAPRGAEKLEIDLSFP